MARDQFAAMRTLLEAFEAQVMDRFEEIQESLDGLSQQLTYLEFVYRCYRTQPEAISGEKGEKGEKGKKGSKPRKGKGKGLVRR